jgi:hypothetical protein
VALMAALANPRRVRALALYEPTLFSQIDAHSPRPNDADGISNVVADAGLCVDAGNLTPRPSASSITDGRRELVRIAERARPDRGIDGERSALGVRAVQRADSAGSIPLARHSGALHGGQALHAPAHARFARLLTSALPRGRGGGVRRSSATWGRLPIPSW